MEDYQKVFQKFVLDGEDREHVVLLMARDYAIYNLKMVEALRAFRSVKASVIEQTDANDKPISAVKADVIADATPEAANYEIARAHVNNIDHYIDSLKTL